MALPTQEPVVQLPDPGFTDPPAVTPDCKICAALYRQWVAASDPTSAGYDPSKATDLRVEMSRHHEEGKS